jgi:transposase
MEAQKFVASLADYEKIYFQDENLNAWKKLWGRQLQHSALGRIKEELRRKPNAVMLDRWLPTTQQCQECERKNRIPLDQRIYSCACGYSKPRDLHGAGNMIILGREAEATPQELGGALVEGGTAGARLKSSSKSTRKPRERKKQEIGTTKKARAAQEAARTSVAP